MSLDYISRMGKKAMWIKQFTCKECGKRHTVEGRRGELNKLKAKREKQCTNLGESDV